MDYTFAYPFHPNIRRYNRSGVCNEPFALATRVIGGGDMRIRKGQFE